MKVALLEHIEAKIINFLRDVNAPCPASQITGQIQETREDTLLAIEKLVKSRTLKTIQDFSLFDSTGETVAYALADPSLLPSSSTAFVPPSRETSTRRGSRLSRYRR
jgi:hypothetical protein